jgi:hypothetical protein
VAQNVEAVLAKRKMSARHHSDGCTFFLTFSTFCGTEINPLCVPRKFTPLLMQLCLLGVLFMFFLSPVVEVAQSPAKCHHAEPDLEEKA